MSFFETRHGSLLSEEISLQVKPGLAVAIGLNNAIVLQQLRFCLAQPKSGKVIDGEKYIWNTYAEWRDEHFPWWSVETLQRVFTALEKQGLIKSIQPDGVVSRKKYYTMCEGAARLLTYERMHELNDRTRQLDVIRNTSTCDHPEHVNLTPSSTETSAETTTETSIKNAEPPAPPIQDDVPFDLAKPTEPPKPKHSKDEMTVLKNTLAEIEGLIVAETTGPSWSKIAKALKIIHAVAPDVTPDELRRRAEINKAANPWRHNLTAMTLASEWGKSGAAPQGQVKKQWKYPSLGRDTLSPIL